MANYQVSKKQNKNKKFTPNVLASERDLDHQPHEIIARPT